MRRISRMESQLDGFRKRAFFLGLAFSVLVVVFSLWSGETLEKYLPKIFLILFGSFVLRYLVLRVFLKRKDY